MDTIDEAVELANETDYSLTAALWTQNVNLALDVAARIRSGETSSILLRNQLLKLTACEGSTSVNGSTVHSEMGLGHAGLG